MRKLLILLVISGIAFTSSAQKQANFWYFGTYAGLNFSLGLPIAMTNGALDTWEGCSSISSAEGQLLFYTDGTYVYNRNHVQMPNGFGLMGDESSTQSGIIVPKPGTTTDFYIFTVDDYAGPNGVRYSRVDMTLAGGLGDVVTSEKNIALVAPTCEKVTAVGHSNGTNFWVITHLWNSNAFHAYEVTTAGVTLTPVVSNVGEVIGGDEEYSKGYLKLSPNGSWIALANNTKFTIGIFSFNNTTGEVTNPIIDNNFSNPGGFDPGGPYGVGFSPDSKLLYIAEWKNGKKLWQYNLAAGSPTEILNSRIMITSIGGSAASLGALQLGPDNRMYIARWQSPYISRITNPAVYGTGCGFVDQAVNLSGKESGYGLPPFIQSFFNLNTDILYDVPVCDGDSIQFYTSTAVPPDSVRWTFGDPASGPFNTSTQLNPMHKFTGTGFYAVKLKLYVGIQSDSILKLVVVNAKPVLDLGDDVAECVDSAIILDAGPDYFSYLWSTGDTSQSIQAISSGTYWCEVAFQSGCSVTDSVQVTVFPKYNITLDTSICEGESLFAGGQFQTQTGTFYDSLFTIEGCDSVFTTNLVVHDTFNVNLDAGICIGDSIFLGGAWQKTSGTYYDVLSTQFGCDSTIITELVVGDNFTINQSELICAGDSLFVGGDWRKTAGSYYDTVSSGTSCDSIFITDLNIADTFLVENTTSICEGDSIFIGGAWQKTEGFYADFLQSQLGCDSTVYTQLIVLPTVYGSSSESICSGDSIYLEGAWRKSEGFYTDILVSQVGCDSVVTTELTVKPNVFSTDEAVICEGDSIFLGGEYRINAGIYQDIFNAYNGCDSIVNTTLSVVETIMMQWDTIICEGDSIFLEGTYQDQPGTYFDYYKAVSGCDSVIATDLSIESLPFVYLGNDTILQEGEVLELDAFYPEASYLWQDGSVSPIYIVREQGNYFVTVTTHCGSVEDSVYVFYGNFFCDPISPNAFSPNQDGTNDVFRPQLPCEILDYKLMIFNRYGELLYTSDDRGEGWDGTIRGGEPAGQGTYVWVLNYRVGLYNNVEDRAARGVVVIIE